MGYMGLGMQSWIYRMKPRKPYSMNRKKSFTHIPQYDRQFKIQPSKNTFDLFPFHHFLIFIFFTMVLIIYKNSWLAHSKELYKSKEELLIQENNRAFGFLISSGKERLKRDNYEGAYSEFKLVMNLFPENLEASKLLEETLSVLCFKDNKYCAELENLEY